MAFRYVAPDGKLDPRWNINGATNAIAGVLSERGNVLGLMPHPENHVEGAIGSTTGAACSRFDAAFCQGRLSRVA